MAINTPGGGGISTFGTFFDSISPGILLAVSVVTEYITLPPKATWVSLCICDQSQNQVNRTITLLSGYPSRENPLTWFGFLPIKDGMSYMLFLRGNLNPIFRMEDTLVPFANYVELLNGSVSQPIA
jgi:hypothetical protein